MTSKDLIDEINKTNIKVKSNLSTLSSEDAQHMRKLLSEKKNTPKKGQETKSKNQTSGQKDYKKNDHKKKDGKEKKFDPKNKNKDKKGPTQKDNNKKNMEKKESKAKDKNKKDYKNKKKIDQNKNKNKRHQDNENQKKTNQGRGNQNKEKDKKDKSGKSNGSKTKGKQENKSKDRRPRQKIRRTGKTERERKKKAALAKEAKMESNKLEIQAPITVKDFAEEISVPVGQVITKLIGLGVMMTQNETIDEDIVIMIADEFDKDVEIVTPEEEETIEDKYELDFEDNPNFLKERPPVVTVMGHVDHGKTSLLDCIKSTRVTEGEAGGITQHIGAYIVNVRNKKVTFLDTPGHEAFTSMRSRGAQITDIAILVVAADDGVMPQTVEAINHAKAADVPIIVAINKMDKPTANPERIKQELTEYNLVPEDWGGDTIVVPVSAKENTGIDELLEMILLVSEIQELKANPNRQAIGTVIEAELDKGKGPMATILVQKGTLRFGDSVVTGKAHGRIRAMTDDKGKDVKRATPSTPVVILGLDEVPNAGDMIYAVSDDKLAREIADKNRENYREEKLANTNKVSLENLFDRIKEGQLKDLNLVVKADVKGSVEALNQSLLKLSNEEVKINIIHSGAGGINESDISLATASNALVIGFNVRPNMNAQELAEVEEVDVRTYRVIYDIINDIKSAVSGLLEPTIVEEILGRCEVRQTFKLPNNNIVAGMYVLKGKIVRNGQVKVLRDDIVIHEGAISSLKRFKDDVREIATGYEGGLTIDNFNDIKVGDTLECFVLKEVKKEL